MKRTFVDGACASARSVASYSSLVRYRSSGRDFNSATISAQRPLRP
jgi:hypothetical protein